ncbi:MAG: hypothetical protein Q8914_11645 [Bacteroidota bacterium]|nr:hypothetical protein [Bacteroidota bacterium]
MSYLSLVTDVSALTRLLVGLLTYLNNKIAAIETRVSQMNQSKSDIEQLGSDRTHIYVLKRPEGMCGSVTKEKDKEVNINAPTDGLAVHEIKHISQSLNVGKLNFYKGALQNAGTSNKERGMNEENAYKAQFSLNGFIPGAKGVHSPNEIVIPLIKGMRDSNGKLLYPYLSEKK